MSAMGFATDRLRLRLRRPYGLRRRRPPASVSGSGRRPLEPEGGQPARMMADALWIEKLTAAEAAEAMRRPAEWVQQVLSGAVDPTLDELEIALNAIGLEARISIADCGRSWPPLPRHDREKLAAKIARHRALDEEMFGEAWIQRGPPQPGATARMFGAGPGRTDGGGWAAILTRNTLSDLGITAAELGSRAGIGTEKAEHLASGEWRPPAGCFERILASVGMPMSIRLEEYETHDDEHQARWEADPAGYEARIDAIREEVHSWKTPNNPARTTTTG